MVDFALGRAEPDNPSFNGVETACGTDHGTVGDAERDDQVGELAESAASFTMESGMIGGVQGVEPVTLGLEKAQFDTLRNVFDVQSCIFTAEIIPVIWNLYPKGIHNLSLLDIGSRTGAGSEMLRFMHHPQSFTRIKLDVTALDVDESYRGYTKALFPELKFIYRDIFAPSMVETYDIVLCSHCLEHVPNPEDFLRRMQELARSWVVVATPFDEKDLIPGHVNRLDNAFFKRTGAHSLKVYDSMTWHAGQACIAVYRGEA